MRMTIFFWLWLSICGYGLIRGGAPERLVALIFLAAAPLSRLAYLYPVNRFSSVEPALFAIDATVLALLVWIALRADRTWPVWQAALQLILVGIHLAVWLKIQEHRWVYQIAAFAIAYPMLAVLLVGTWRHRQRLTQSNANASSPR